jgi:hypothetical protein
LPRKEVSSGKKDGLVPALPESTYLPASPFLRKEVSSGKKAELVPALLESTYSTCQLLPSREGEVSSGIRLAGSSTAGVNLHASYSLAEKGGKHC